MESEKTYKFQTDGLTYEKIESKGEKKYFITGYISTKNRDLVNDTITEVAMSDMLNQVLTGNIKLDAEHEAWREENPSIIPLGKIIDAKKDERGIFVKAQLNASHSRFKEVWNSIKDGFLDAFSIAYKATDYTHTVIDGVKTRILNGIKLLNVALTGNPVNPECRMFDVFTKSIQDYKKMEETTMKEEIEKKDAPDEETTTVEESTVEEKSEGVSLKDFEELKSKLEKENEELKTEIKSLKAKIAEPVIKAEQKSLDEVKENLKSKVMNPLDMI